jgi:hypothetical protein
MYNNQIINSTNKTKATWNIIKAETNRLKGPTTSTINNYFKLWHPHCVLITEYKEWYQVVKQNYIYLAI